MSQLQLHADRIAWQEDGTCIFTLRRPLESSSRGTLTVLTVKRPLLGDLLDNEKQAGDDMLKSAITIATLCDLKLPDLDDVLGSDTMLLAEIMTTMLEYGEEGSLLDRHADRLTVTDFDVALSLRNPVKTINEGEVEDIVVRQPTLKEVRSNQGTTLGASVKLLSILTSLGPAVLRRLDAVDGMILAEQVNDFLGKSRRSSTGAR